MTCLCEKCVRARREIAERNRVPDSPVPGTEWSIRYRALGPSAVWEGMTVCEVVGGPQDGEQRVLDNREFETRLRKMRRVRMNGQTERSTT